MLIISLLAHRRSPHNIYFFIGNSIQSSTIDSPSIFTLLNLNVKIRSICQNYCFVKHISSLLNQIFKKNFSSQRHDLPSKTQNSSFDLRF